MNQEPTSQLPVGLHQVNHHGMPLAGVELSMSGDPNGHVYGVPTLDSGLGSDLHLDSQPAPSKSAEEPSYDDMFPSLPETEALPQQPAPRTFAVQRKHPTTSSVTQVFRVAPENRKFQEQNQRISEQQAQAKVCKDIMLKTNTLIEVSSSKDGTLTFLISGKEDAVQQAKRSISSDLQTQASAQLSIPKDHHRFILGKNGKKLNDLQTATGTKISVPRQSDDSNFIKIVGPKEAIEKAVHELQVISNEVASRAVERLVIEKEYHPFISGAYGEALKQLTADTGAKINIPPPSVNKNEISISGEKDGVARAREVIMRIYEEKKKNTQTVCVEVKKQQHRYVIGPKGATLQEIFKQTGVSLEMPPTDNPSETITLRGEQEKLGPALTLLYEKAHSEIDEELDAPSWIQKYIIGPKGAHFQEISQDFHTTVNVSFAANENKIKMHGPKKDVERAKQVLEAEIKRVKRDVNVREMAVDSKYHRFLIGKSGQTINQIRAKTGAQINIPAETEGTTTDVIRIEGGAAEVESAKAEIEAIIKKRMETESNVSKDLIIEQRFHKQIIGTKGEKIRDVRDRFNQVVITFPESSVKSDKVAIRGPKEDVDSCYKYLATLNKELLASNYRAEVPIFKPFHKFIIGKDGANIRKIRDETGTKIDLPSEDSNSDVIIITGKKESVDKATERIQEFQNELTNVQQVDIIIPAKFHNSIIGAKGRQIRSIMEECGGVHIKFPTEGSGSDKVSIRGPKDCVAKAKTLLVGLTNDKVENSFTAEVKARPEHHRFIIGKNGANIKKVRESSGARIFFPSDKDVGDDSDTIVLTGKKEDVLKAKQELEEMIKDLEKIVEDELHVDPKHHKHFVAKRGSILRQISEELGGVLISFPRSTQKDSDLVTLKGSKECVDRAKQRILEEVENLESMVNVECVIEQQHHRAVMGARGNNVQSIQTEHKVHIKFPERAQRTNGNAFESASEHAPSPHLNGDGVASDDEASEKSDGTSPRRKRCDVILISGRLANCEAAKEALLASIPIEVEVEVPFDYHRFIIGQKGREVRELMDTYDVSIAVPPSSDQSDIIRISGMRENAERARVGILDKVKQLDEEKQERDARSHRVELHVDPAFHPKIIGKKGVVITKIRQKHDVQIQFPERSGDNAAADPTLITIIGYEAKANAAKEEILGLVGDMESQVTVEFKVDSRVHRRIIGGRGKGVGKIMDTYHVNVKFPKSGGTDPDLVTISGKEEDVLAAKDHILNLEEEYLDDENDQYLPPRSQPGGGGERQAGGGKGSGFSVKGGPWEAPGPQLAPDTNNADEFPSMSVDPSSGGASAGSWGGRFQGNSRK